MKKIVVFVAAVFVLLFSGCAREGDAIAEPLRIGILADVNSLPIMLARDEGLFEREGVQVEVILFSSAAERDAALQTGHLDGANSSVLSAAFFAAGGFDFAIASLTNGRYGIVGAPALGLESLEDLRGRSIGLSLNTIIQYTVDMQMYAAGVSVYEFEAVAVPNMPVRLQMVLEGLIDAAGLPEPMLTAAAAQGATLLSTTDGLGLYAGILLFSRSSLDNRLEDIRAFYRAYYAAAQMINADPDAFRDYLVEQAGFPEAVRDAFHFVTYLTPALPDRAQIIQALDWLRYRGLLTADLAPEDLVDARAISEWL